MFRIGPLRCTGDSGRKERPFAGLLPACLFQEHPRNRSGHQRMEAAACRSVPRERYRAQGGYPHETVRR